MTIQRNFSKISGDAATDLASAVGYEADTDLVQKQHVEQRLTEVSGAQNTQISTLQTNDADQNTRLTALETGSDTSSFVRKSDSVSSLVDVSSGGASVGDALVWDGANWVASDQETSNTSIERIDSIATAGQTEFPVASDTVPFIALNGVVLHYPTDFTFADGVVTFNPGLDEGDLLTGIGWVQATSGVVATGSPGGTQASQVAASEFQGAWAGDNGNEFEMQPNWIRYYKFGRYVDLNLTGTILMFAGEAQSGYSDTQIYVYNTATGEYILDQYLPKPDDISRYYINDGRITADASRIVVGADRAQRKSDGITEGRFTVFEPDAEGKYQSVQVVNHPDHPPPVASNRRYGGAIGLSSNGEWVSCQGDNRTLVDIYQYRNGQYEYHQRITKDEFPNNDQILNIGWSQMSMTGNGSRLFIICRKTVYYIEILELYRLVNYTSNGDGTRALNWIAHGFGSGTAYANGSNGGLTTSEVEAGPEPIPGQLYYHYLQTFVPTTAGLGTSSGMSVTDDGKRLYYGVSNSTGGAVVWADFNVDTGLYEETGVLQNPSPNKQNDDAFGSGTAISGNGKVLAAGSPLRHLDGDLDNGIITTFRAPS